MKTTIFNTPILTNILRRLAEILLRLAGWKTEGHLPDLPKCVVIGAPHTSNWDFVLMLALGFSERATLRFMGKAELFRSPLAFFFYWCGGIPVERSKSTGLVEQVTQAIQQSERFILIITPEGTRKKVREWKSGFYRIAKSANIPVVLAYIDGKRKVVGIGKTFTLTDNMETDMQAIQSFYAGLEGINPR